MEDQEWVHDMLQIKTLRYFDIRMTPGRYIYELEIFRDKFMPWLRHVIVNRSKSVGSDEPQKERTSSFPFLSLPRKLRNEVYRLIAIPPNRRIHPEIGGWYNETARDACNMSLACTQVRFEISKILYGEAIFASEFPGHHLNAVMRFLKTQHSAAKHASEVMKSLHKWKEAPSLDLESKMLTCNIWPIRHIALAVGESIHELHYLPELVKGGHIESLELAIHGHLKAITMKLDWNNLSPAYRLGQWRGGFTCEQLIAIAHIPHVQVQIVPKSRVHTDCLNWLEDGMRHELLKGKTEIADLDWLYTPLNEVVVDRPLARGRMPIW